MTSNPLAELLAAVRADPDDVTTRAVFADALVQAGDPRGELVAAYVAADRSGLADHRAELLAGERARLDATYPDLVYSLRKGLVDSIVAKHDQVGLATQMMRMEPIREVTIEAPRGKTEGVAWTFTLDEIPISRLTLRNTNARGAASIAVILNCKGLRSVRALTLEGNRLGSDPVDTLTTSQWLDNVEQLALIETGADDAWATRLAHGRERGKLASITFQGDAPTWNGIAELLETLWAPIKSLTLRANMTGPVERVLRAPGLATLAELRVTVPPGIDEAFAGTHVKVQYV